jgi:hypothetical protein
LLPDVICGNYRQIHFPFGYHRPRIWLETDTPVFRLPCQPSGGVILRYADYSESEREALRVGEGRLVQGVLRGVEGVEGELVGEKLGVGRGGRFGMMVRERRWEAEPEKWSVPKW